MSAEFKIPEVLITDEEMDFFIARAKAAPTVEESIRVFQHCVSEKIMKAVAEGMIAPMRDFVSNEISKMLPTKPVL